MNFLAHRDTMVTVSVEPAPPLAELGARWRDLESRADGSFFTSWTWVGAWLSTFGDDGRLPEIHLLVARVGSVTAGLALVGTRPMRSVLMRSILKNGRVCALHQSGVREDDALFIEYNDFLLDRRFASPARAAMLAAIAAEKKNWREFRLSGVVPVLHRAVEQGGLNYRIISDRLCPWVDLAKVPPGRSGYLAVLSRNTRQQIQRSVRLYEAEGALDLAPARDSSEARAMLSEMAALHQKSWQDREGHRGAFGSARFARFADRLVETGNPDGSVQLLRARAGSRPLGYLLNFVHRGHAYAYQSGFAYRDDNRFRPGLVSHVLAIVRAREQGLRGYHFMAGEGRYKSSLANADEHLLWMTLRHDTPLSRAEDAARAMKARFAAFVRGLRR